MSQANHLVRDLESSKRGRPADQVRLESDAEYSARPHRPQCACDGHKREGISQQHHREADTSQG